MGRPSPLQNRVTPFGEIVAVTDRGLFIGNRGVIHDRTKPVLLNRRWSSKSWLVCVLDFKGIRRTVMGPGRWTELFFLDEATALAAGHRPCFECRRADALAFRAAWAGGNGGAPPPAPHMDAVLHAERLDGRGKRLHPLDRPIAELPDGAMIGAGGGSYLIVGGQALAWTPAGYAAAPPPKNAWLLTPPSTLRALAAGYRPILHSSAGRPAANRDSE